MNGTIYCGICDRCKVIKQFPSDLQRDMWEKHHLHTDEDPPDPESGPMAW